MGYQSHPHCETPPDDAVIWRYTDFLKFSAMLANKGLWCSRADLLGDWREGRFTAEEERQLSTPELRNAFGNNRRLTFVNCWHESRIESMAMWDLYGRGVGSVALRSTVGNLKTALSSADREFYLSRTKYLDWERGSSFPNNLFGMFVRKADAYKHEQEVRLLTWRPELQWETSATPSGGLVLNRLSDWLCERLIESNYEADENTLKHECLKAYARSLEEAQLRRVPSGLVLAADLRALFTEVVVGPNEEQWIFDLVAKTLQLHGLPHPIWFSDLRAS